jgi:hypothetical protein
MSDGYDPEHDIPDEYPDPTPDWFCGCGNPRAAAAFLRDVLESVEARAAAPGFFDDRAACEAASKRFEQRQAELMPTEGLRYLVWYLLDHVGVMEHGFSIPGKITADGKKLLERLRTRPEDFE